ncbi:ABC transporter [Bacillus thuringiensis]|uniref:ABC transporter n=1 Tax=Bacillus thuringiensis TaxID=1428 RepID=A0A9X6WSA1_BACTU|nr:ABC transporter ATP-binding protein [Bacillus thuringiensis]PFJ42571.1 ABC transporter [Bacillus thuringiensis]PFN60568.1 ABC transporter [Bacillus thuringiensis]PFV34468.1 ABC transporter [Bacillus thuringiensis]
MSTIVAKDITHLYMRNKTLQGEPALNNISITINSGDAFGILGPNGAGKTTLIKILSTLLYPSRGSVFIDGNEVQKNTKKIRKQIGIVLGGERGLYWKLSGRENLYFFAELYDMEPKEYKVRVEELLKQFNLSAHADKLVETYSRGMKQRLHIARGMLTNPKILFFDEPTNGIDIDGTQEIKNMIKELSKLNKTIIYTSHLLTEAEELCNKIAFLKNGNLIALDTPNDLKRKLKNVNIVDIKFKKLDELELSEFLEVNSDVLVLEKGNNSIKLEVPLSKEPFPLLIKEFNISELSDIKVHDFSLEDTYRAIMGGV